jgi:hypothetical protein
VIGVWRGIGAGGGRLGEWQLTKGIEGFLEALVICTMSAGLVD